MLYWSIVCTICHPTSIKGNLFWRVSYKGLTPDLEDRMVTDDRASEEDEHDYFTLKQRQYLRLGGGDR